MATSYTTFLGLALPVTGELSGTWGDTVNNYISNYIDAAVAGAQTVTTDTTLTKTTGTSLGSTSSQYAIIIASPASANITITAPAASKIYTIINTSATYTVKIVGAGPTTGVTLGVSEKAQVAWNGSDFVRIGASGGPGVFSSITNTGLTSGRVVYSTTGGLETGSANLLYSGTDLTVYGITVGRGAGAVSTNTAVGASALGANTSGSLNTAIGYQAGLANTTAAGLTLVGHQAGVAATAGNLTGVGYQALVSNTSGIYNTALGQSALQANTTASYNTAVGYQAGYSNTTASNNTAVGYQAGYSTTTGGNGVYIGQQAGYSGTTAIYNTFVGQGAGYNTTGGINTFVGPTAGYSVSTGAKNTILGAYNGNQGGLDIRTANNYIVLSDGDGNPQVAAYNGGTLSLAGAVPVAGTGVTFPATQSASSDVNTLDDYEEGTFTPTIIGTSVAGVGTYTIQIGRYTKIGDRVIITVALNWTAHTGSGSMDIGGFPFASANITNLDQFFFGVFSNITYTKTQRWVALGANLTRGYFAEGDSNQSGTSMPLDTAGYIGFTGQYLV